MIDLSNDIPYMGSDIIDTTLRAYPKMAKAGWCFSGNVSKVDVPDGSDQKEFVNKKIKNYTHMEADAMLIGYGKYKAYWTSGHMDLKMLPTFVRVNNKKFLEELGFKKRDVWVDAGLLEPNYEITRFELMILGDV